MILWCQLCSEPLPPRDLSEEKDEGGDIVTKFTAQLQDNTDGGNEQVEELQRLSGRSVCVQCRGCLEGAVAKRGEVNAAEEQVRKLQVEVVKLMRSLKRLLADYVDELWGVRGRMGDSDEVKLEDPAGQTLKMQVIHAIQTLSNFREDLNRKTVFENHTVLESPALAESAMEMVECEWDDGDVELHEMDDTEREEEDEWLPSRSLLPTRSRKRVTSDCEDDEEPQPPESEDDLDDTVEHQDKLLPKTNRQAGKRVSSDTSATPPTKRKRGRPKKVREDVDEEEVNPKCTFPRKYKPSWLTHQRWTKKNRGDAGRRLLTCQTCPNFSIRNQYAFEGHLRQHEKQLTTPPATSETTEPRPCPHCSLSFLHPQMWEWHVYSHEGHVRHRCDLCAKMLPCFSMANHLYEDHGVERVISCPSCSSCHSAADKYLEHLRLHRNMGDSQACYLCPSRFGTRKSLLQHLYDAHQALPKLHCSETGCSQEFLDAMNLRIHESCHKAHFACLDCNKVFKHKHLYQTHIESEHQGKRWTCAHCGVQRKTEQSLKQHEKTHEITGQPWQCPNCPKKFKQEITLRQHQRLHEGQGFVCDQCGATFTTATILKKHVKYIHQMTEEEKVQCDLCGSRFKKKNDLKRHLQKHAEGRQWECDTCHKRFRTEKDLENHRRSRHTGEKPHVCAVCGKAFGHPGSLRDHRRLAHGTQNRH